jgi:hypothetical protein
VVIAVREIEISGIPFMSVIQGEIINNEILIWNCQAADHQPEK